MGYGKYKELLVEVIRHLMARRDVFGNTPTEYGLLCVSPFPYSYKPRLLNLAVKEWLTRTGISIYA